MLGFKFNNVHCNDIGICMKSKNRPVMPLPKIVEERLPSRDGVIDFSLANPSRRMLYNNREISVDCNFIASSLTDFREKARAIAKWLACGIKNLEFDDEPHIFYRAKVANRLDLTQQLKRGFFTIIFDCEPFAYGPCIVDMVSQGDGYNNFRLTGPRTVTVQNPGYYVRPEIYLEGSCTNLRMEHLDKSLSYFGSHSGSLIFNCNTMTAIANNNNVLASVAGDFFELAGGDNAVSITADSINCRVFFLFEPAYL